MTLYRAALIALGLLLLLIGFLSIDYLNVKKQAAVYSRSVENLVRENGRLKTELLAARMRQSSHQHLDHHRMALWLRSLSQEAGDQARLAAYERLHPDLKSRFRPRVPGGAVPPEKLKAWDRPDGEAAAGQSVNMPAEKVSRAAPGK